eukprot:3315143-Pyramimonas_sp.AAC.1
MVCGAAGDRCGSKNVYYTPSKPQILAGPYRDNLGHPKHTEEDAWKHPIFQVSCPSNIATRPPTPPLVLH